MQHHYESTGLYVRNNKIVVCTEKNTTATQHILPKLQTLSFHSDFSFQIYTFETCHHKNPTQLYKISQDVGF